MNCKKNAKILVIFFLLFNFKLVQANEKIVYIDMNKVMTNSLVGQSVNTLLTKYNKDKTNNFKKKVEDLKSQEKKLVAQKNIIDESEFKKQYEKIKLSFSDHNKSIDNFNRDFEYKTIISRKLILEELTPILSNYAKKNLTSLILNKKDVIIGKTNLDITEQIIKTLDKKIQKIKLEDIK